MDTLLSFHTKHMLSHPDCKVKRFFRIPLFNEMILYYTEYNDSGRQPQSGTQTCGFPSRTNQLTTSERMLCMKRKSLALAAALAILPVCSACHSYVTYTYDVSSGAQVTLDFDTSGGYKVKDAASLPFSVTKDGETLLQGTFITGDQFDQYKEVVNTDPSSTLLEETTVDGYECIIWNYNDEEYNAVIDIPEKDSGLVLGSTLSEEGLREGIGIITIDPED